MLHVPFPLPPMPSVVEARFRAGALRQSPPLPGHRCLLPLSSLPQLRRLELDVSNKEFILDLRVLTALSLLKFHIHGSISLPSSAPWWPASLQELEMGCLDGNSPLSVNNQVWASLLPPLARLMLGYLGREDWTALVPHLPTTLQHLEVRNHWGSMHELVLPPLPNLTCLGFERCASHVALTWPVPPGLRLEGWHSELRLRVVGQGWEVVADGSGVREDARQPADVDEWGSAHREALQWLQAVYARA